MRALYLKYFSITYINFTLTMDYLNFLARYRTLYYILEHFADHTYSPHNRTSKRARKKFSTRSEASTFEAFAITEDDILTLTS